MNNRRKLKKCIKANNLTIAEAAKLMGIPYFTLIAYLRPVTSKAHRICPDHIMGNLYKHTRY